jgi:hypothetical protein
MIVFEKDGKEYRIPNKADEVSLNQLSHISDLMNDKKNDQQFHTRWMAVLEYLGGKKLKQVITSKALTSYIESFDITDIDNEVSEIITVQGKEYKCVVEDGELQMSGMDIAEVEQAIATNEDVGKKVFAIIYKDETMGFNDHYNAGHLKKKTDLFGQHVTALIAAPVIYQINKGVMDNVEALRKAHA